MFSRLQSPVMTLILVVVPLRGTVYGQVVVPLQVTGDPAKRVDLAILGDGYTTGELGKFATDVNQFLAGVFAQSPFDEYKNFLNVRRIDVASNESGADHPERT